MRGNKRMVFALIVLAFVGGGCEKKPVPPGASKLEVNDENCKPESIAKIGDKATQQEFAARCVRRGGGDGQFKASPKREW